MVEYYLRFTYVADKVNVEQLQDELGPFTSEEFLTILAGIQDKIRAGTVKAKARSHTENFPDMDQEWYVDTEYLSDISAAIPKNEQTPKPNPDTYPDAISLPKIDFDKVEIKTVTFDDKVKQQLNEKIERLSNPDPEMLSGLKAVALEQMKALEEKWNQEEEEDDEEFDEQKKFSYYQPSPFSAPSQDSAREILTENDEEDEGWIVDRPRVRTDLLDLFQDRVEALFSLTDGAHPIENDPDEYPQYNNDGFELAILDGYLTYQELVDEFANTLKRYLENAADQTGRSYRDAINTTLVDLDNARPNPSFLKNFKMGRESLPPESEDDQDWVAFLPENMRDQK